MWAIIMNVLTSRDVMSKKGGKKLLLPIAVASCLAIVAWGGMQARPTHIVAPIPYENHGWLSSKPSGDERAMYLTREEAVQSGRLRETSGATALRLAWADRPSGYKPQGSRTFEGPELARAVKTHFGLTPREPEKVTTLSGFDSSAAALRYSGFAAITRDGVSVTCGLLTDRERTNPFGEPLSIQIVSVSCLDSNGRVTTLAGSP